MYGIVARIVDWNMIARKGCTSKFRTVNMCNWTLKKNKYAKLWLEKVTFITN